MTLLPNGDVDSEYPPWLKPHGGSWNEAKTLLEIASFANPTSGQGDLGAHAIEDKGGREFLVKALNGLPTRTMHGNDHLRCHIFQLTDGLFDDGFKSGPCKMKPSKDGMHFPEPGKLLRMQDGIDNP